MKVSRNVSSRVGHTHFRSSAMVSWKNFTGLPLRTALGEIILGVGPLADDLATALPHFPVTCVAMATRAVFS